MLTNDRGGGGPYVRLRRFNCESSLSARRDSQSTEKNLNQANNHLIGGKQNTCLALHFFLLASINMHNDLCAQRRLCDHKAATLNLDELE